MYAFDAVLSALLVSRDGGRTFTEEFTPRGLIIDFEVDPADPAHVVASNAEELYRSRTPAPRGARSTAARESAWPGPRRTSSTAR